MLSKNAIILKLKSEGKIDDNIMELIKEYETGNHEATFKLRKYISSNLLDEIRKLGSKYPKDFMEALPHLDKIMRFTPQDVLTYATLNLPLILKRKSTGLTTVYNMIGEPGTGKTVFTDSYMNGLNRAILEFVKTYRSDPEKGKDIIKGMIKTIAKPLAESVYGENGAKTIDNLVENKEYIDNLVENILSYVKRYGNKIRESDIHQNTSRLTGKAKTAEALEQPLVSYEAGKVSEKISPIYTRLPFVYSDDLDTSDRADTMSAILQQVSATEFTPALWIINSNTNPETFSFIGDMLKGMTGIEMKSEISKEALVDRFGILFNTGKKPDERLVEEIGYVGLPAELSYKLSRLQFLNDILDAYGGKLGYSFDPENGKATKVKPDEDLYKTKIDLMESMYGESFKEFMNKFSKYISDIPMDVWEGMKDIINKFTKDPLQMHLNFGDAVSYGSFMRILLEENGVKNIGDVLRLLDPAKILKLQTDSFVEYMETEKPISKDMLFNIREKASKLSPEKINKMNGEFNNFMKSIMDEIAKVVNNNPDILERSSNIIIKKGEDPSKLMKNIKNNDVDRIIKKVNHRGICEVADGVLNIIKRMPRNIKILFEDLHNLKKMKENGLIDSDMYREMVLGFTASTFGLESPVSEAIHNVMGIQSFKIETLKDFYDEFKKLNIKFDKNGKIDKESARSVAELLNSIDPDTFKTTKFGFSDLITFAFADFIDKMKFMGDENGKFIRPKELEMVMKVFANDKNMGIIAKEYSNITGEKLASKFASLFASKKMKKIDPERPLFVHEGDILKDVMKGKIVEEGEETIPESLRRLKDKINELCASGGGDPKVASRIADNIMNGLADSPDLLKLVGVGISKLVLAKIEE